ncbi:MAG: M60 family metallopeptidase, partial [Bacteroidaceae bacterium]
YDFKKNSNPTTIYFGETGIDNITDVQFVITSGGGNFASCAEMQFFQINPLTKSIPSSLFEDKAMTRLKATITQTDIDAIGPDYALYKDVAQQMLNNTYSTKYRYSSHKCLLSPKALSEKWNTPGKLYDQIQGVTGILLSPGKHLVAVSGIPANKTVTLKVINWYAMPTDADFAKNKNAKGWYTQEQYNLQNGINIIQKSTERSGLAYIDYYDDNPKAYANQEVQVHFLNGKVQGYLSPDKTNDEMQQLLNNAPYQCMDCFGSKVHSIWEVSALQQHATGKYRQYLNVIDTLIAWEHRLLGLEKYKHIPENKTMAYVNYDYYMYQGGFGVSFMYDTQHRSCSPENIMKNDNDVVWGLSHEWGHQHQMQPYFCWAGLAESSNNMNSCYNVLHMGYDMRTTGRIFEKWADARKHFINANPEIPACGKNGCSSARRLAYAARTKEPFISNMQMQAVFEAMADSTVTTIAKNPDRAISTSEVNVEENLAPFFMLHTYCSTEVSAGGEGLPDYTPDLYESLRNTNSGTDKYELIASAQNGKEGRYATLATTYPQSCWVTNCYVSEKSTIWENSVPYIFNYVRKASKISGYNLYPYFEKWGFFRLIAMEINDYGTKYYCMTQDMRDEFKADMEALVTNGTLKTMPGDLIMKIATIAIPKYDTPIIPN